MAMTVRGRLVKIGNSQGIRIPRLLLEQAGLSETDEVEVEAQDQQLLVRAVRPVGRARAGWDEQFRAMAAHGDDRLLDEDLTGHSHFDASEWEW